MPQQITINAKDFKLRQDLENEVLRLTGGGTEDKPGFLIKGKRIELEKLFLNDNRKVYGIRCEITDTPSQIREKNVADRGERHSFGINNNLEI